jgi:4-amino-4-deoxy-L-arabinose transferase-like glycosyltransferase
MNVQATLEKHYFLLLTLTLVILGILFFLKISTVDFHPGWDESTYIGMGKYYLSLGDSGIVESLRPPVLPLITGILWQLGNSVLLTRLLSVLFMLGIVLVGSTLTSQLYDRRSGLLFALFASASPLLLHFSTRILTELPTAFFLLLGLLLYQKKQYSSAGVIFAIATLTKFPAGLSLLCLIGLWFLWPESKEQGVQPLIGFAVPFGLYLISNWFMYGSPIEPFITGNKVISTAGLWLYLKPWWFYLAELIKENIFMLLAPFGAYVALQTPHRTRTLLVSLSVLLLMYFTNLPHKEVRFMILFFPLLLVLAAGGTVALADKLRPDHRVALLVVLGFVWLLLIQGGMQYYTIYEYQPPAGLDSYYTSSTPGIDARWVSSPRFASYTSYYYDLLYYPILDQKKIDEYVNSIDASDSAELHMNTCDLGCAPGDDSCEELTNQLLTQTKKRMTLVTAMSIGNCDYLHYRTI